MKISNNKKNKIIKDLNKKVKKYKYIETMQLYSDILNGNIVVDKLSIIKKIKLYFGIKRFLKKQLYNNVNTEYLETIKLSVDKELSQLQNNKVE